MEVVALEKKKPETIEFQLTSVRQLSSTPDYEVSDSPVVARFGVCSGVLGVQFVSGEGSEVVSLDLRKAQVCVFKLI